MEQALSAQEWQLLSGCALFQGCAREEVQLALEDAACTLGVYETGQTVYQPDHFSRCLGVLLSGGIRVTRDSLAISVLSPGELFGAAALFNDRPDYATTLTACAPCRVVLLPQELVSRLMDASPRIRDNYIRYLSGRIRFLSGRIRSLAAEGVEGKLKQHLLTTLSPTRTRLSCPATELAQRLGISRASLYRAFDALEEQGLIRREGRSIVVPDLSALDASSL
ncbi:MAG: Crp/Fnr family transcriptional regulator [Oscillospiraceae bacterium]|nr:Crp/Fnr family transcriptional regulator [Oscillospiraceae bacterium]